MDKDSEKSFLENIEDLARRQKSSLPDNYAGQINDLSTISPDNYPEVVSSEKTARKIDELKSIISSIEERPATISEIRLARSYRIDYRRELNPAQLEAVTSIDGPVLVIAGAWHRVLKYLPGVGLVTAKQQSHRR